MNIYILCVISFASGAIRDVKQTQTITVKPLTTTEKEIPENECVKELCLTLCHNDGECITNPSTCKTKCACAKGYHGEMCQYRSDKRNNSEDHDKKDRNVLKSEISSSDCSGQACIHGECVSAPFGTTRCHCYDGWFGANCGTSGAVIDDDFLKAMMNKDGKLVVTETKERFHTPEGDRHLKSMTESADVDDILKAVIKNSTRTLPRKENKARLQIPEKEASVESKSVEVNSTGAADNNTVTEDILNAKYNVCTEDAAERTDEERTCQTARDMKCIYGVCNETLTDHGSWKGYTTVCNCDIGARGTHCEHKCCLDCGENGKCDVQVDGDNVTEHCNCRNRYTGFFCEIYVPDPVSIQIKEDTWYLWVVGVCVGTFAILVTLAVAGPYFMWKHRVILVMKIVHYFQAYEDDDEKEWDAFVSYKSHPTDENFVVRVLYPKLEKELGFKLCLHFRDFVPGETISNNIINAVEGSRRTILILTPRYVESEFTRFEYQKAQTEMLKRKHRIIPIMLEDISEMSDIDKNLKGIIGSVTYLEWPGSDESTNSSKKLDKFWKRLQLSLPKKKVSDCEKSVSRSSPPIVSSFTSPSKEVIIPSDRDSGFKSSINSYTSRSSTASETIDNWWCSDSTYARIGDICEDLGESVKPLSEEEELELIARGTQQKVDRLTYDYVDIVHNCHSKPDVNPPSARLSKKELPDNYIEFELEDNTSSANVIRKELPENYIEFELEDNLQSANITKKELPENYIEFTSENNPTSASIVKKELPENYIEFTSENNSTSASIIKKELPENYIEFTPENNSTSASITKKELPENYIEFSLEDNLTVVNVVKKELPENYIEFSLEENPTSANIVMKELPENYIEFKLEESSPLASPSKEELPENYIEFKVEDNPPSGSLSRTKFPVIQLYTEDYIEIDV
ncbi:uncharacterized protein LOC123527575 [Mercenaria mercenaria]|uniref:uncharacterized protein LOC123527575 n=1 Tax=Mercenaria mercenaria TaxID=6596 RepID=UPI00234E5188|nr:uncharacterized protein LOC123527575 [Mercenaria mercenaria]